jgi:hypothetical protein
MCVRSRMSQGPDDRRSPSSNPVRLRVRNRKGARCEALRLQRATRGDAVVNAHARIPPPANRIRPPRRMRGCVESYFDPRRRVVLPATADTVWCVGVERRRRPSLPAARLTSPGFLSRTCDRKGARLRGTVVRRQVHIRSASIGPDLRVRLTEAPPP